MSDFLTAEDLRTPLPRRFREFPVQFNGCVKTVRIRSLTEMERASFEVCNLDAKGAFKMELSMKMKIKLLCLCVVDKDGNPLLKPQDAKALESQDSAVTGRIYDECVVHCGIRGGGVEAAVKNSDATDADSVASS